MTNQFIIEVTPQHFHLLPGKSTTQDLHMGSVKSGGLLYAKYVYQKDGSRFKVIYSKKFDQADIVVRLKMMFPEKSDIWLQTKPGEHQLLEHVARAAGKEYGASYEYRAYWVHTFLNGKRYIPILINKKAKTFYDVSGWLIGLCPEDDMGVLCDSVTDLVLGDVLVPTEISYQSFIRLCPTCGIVSDTAKPKQNPWLSKKHV